MDALSIRELVTVESAPATMPSSPARAYHDAPQREESIEMQPLPRAATVPPKSGRVPRMDAAQDVEMSRPASPLVPSDGVEILPSITDPYRNRFRFAATCFMLIQNGLNDSAPGALIPYMEK